MYLQKLEIQGFKSFAAKSSLVFTRGIAAIVGPNGSGKSNVADAVRWVLGEQSMKVLRGKRSEDIIFSGSDKKGKLGMAEVSITLNNDDRKMPVDFSEVVITRRVYRNGEGEYFLNKQPARLQDIVLLLARSNFGQKAYSVIGQGMIDHILVATPQERKEFFDEAAGVRQYQIKRDQALNKLEATRENLRQAEMLMQEVEPRLRSLTRQVRRLERRQEVETELRGLQETYYGQVWADLSTKHSAEQRQYDSLAKVQAKAAADLEAVQHELETLEREKSQDQAFRDLQREYTSLLDEKNALMKEQVVLKGRQEIEATQQGQLNVVWLENRASELDRGIRDYEHERKDLDELIANDEANFARRSTEQAKMLKEFSTIEQALLKATTRLESGARLDVKELRTDLAEAAEAQEQLIEALARTEDLSALARLKRDAEAIGESMRRLLARLSDDSAEHDPSAVLALQAKLTEFLKTKDSLVNEIHLLENRLGTAKEKLSSLKQSLDRLTNERRKITLELERSKLEPNEKGKALKLFQAEDDVLQKSLDALDARLKTLAESIQDFNVKAQGNRERLFALQKSFREHQQTLNGENAKLNAIQIELARLETRKDDLEREFRAELPEEATQRVLKSTTPGEQSERRAESELQEEILRLKHSLELIGGIDEGVSEEFETTNERFQFLEKQSADLKSALEQLEHVIRELDETIRKQFDESFEKINQEFQRSFRVLFQGGNAKLVLRKEDVYAPVEEDDADEDDDEDEDEEEASAPIQKPTGEKVIVGIDIIATPPGKKLQNVTMLSGGERALTSIALIAAIIANNPSPFVVLDEVDAALDEANSQRFAAIVADLTEKTQFVIISHNRATMERAALLYGVTMGDDGVSKLISVKMEEADSVIARHGNR
jgi:chromosome segregation protein